MSLQVPENDLSCRGCTGVCKGVYITIKGCGEQDQKGCPCKGCIVKAVCEDICDDFISHRRAINGADEVCRISTLDRRQVRITFHRGEKSWMDVKDVK